MSEVELFFTRTGFIIEQLIEVAVGIVDDQGGGTGKVLVSPCIGEDVHGDTDRLRAFVFGEGDGRLEQLAVRLADQPVFVFITLGGAVRRFCMQVIGKKMEGRPNACNILQTDDIGSGVHELQLQLGGRRGQRRLERIQQGTGAQVYHLVAVADRQALLMGIARKHCRGVGGVIVKIRVHALTPSRACFLIFLSVTEE